MGHVQDNAEECVRRAIEALKDAEYVYPMDPDFDGRPREIRVQVTVDRAKREAVIDFTGTTAELATNYNAPEPVTRAAVLYVFRCLVDDDIPMNEGVMKPLRVILPPGTMLSPRVSGGGDRGERRDEPGGDLGAVPGAGGAGGGAVDDEQHHLGGRPAAVLRDGLRRDRGRGAVGRAGASGDERGAFAHDELAADRPGGAGVALSGGAGRVPAAAGVRAARGGSAAATGWSGGSGSWRR